MTIYHCILFEQEDFFNNQTIEELLREKAGYFISKNKLNDFWLVLDPFYLKDKDFIRKFENTKFSIINKNKKTSNNFIVLMSTDNEFIKWMQLRIGFFEDLNDPLSKKDFTSNGVSFSLDSLDSSSSPLSHNPDSLAPTFLVKQLKSIVMS